MSWRTVNLGELVDNFSVRAKDHDSDTSELEFCGVSNEEGITKSKYAAEDKAEDYKIIEKDCFAYNPYRINVGSIGLLEDDTVGLISPAYVVFKPKPRSIIPQLLLKFLKSAEGLRQIKLYARGTVRQALRFEDLCKIELAIPDYEEQLDFFKRIEETEIESTEISTELTHQIDLVKQLRQAFLREAMQGKLVPQDPNDEPASVLLEKIKAEKERLVKEKKIKKQKPLPPITEDEIPFEIPVNWVWCRLGVITDFISGNNFKSGDFFKGDGAKCIKITNAGIHEIVETDDVLPLSFKEEYSQYLVYEGDLVLALTRPYISNGLKISQCPSSYNMSLLNQRVAVIRPFLDELKDYAYSYLKSDYILNHYKSMFEGKGQQPNLRKDHVTDLLIPLPPLSEQQRIVAKLDELMAYCDALEASIKESQQQNELLLQQVLREALEPAAA